MAGDRLRWPDPADLLDHLGIDRPQDIDLEAIAQYGGATIRYEPLRGCEARLLARKDRAIITVNPPTHPHRWRFSAAHELGHWILDRRRTAFACTKAMLAKGWDHSAGRRGQNDPEQRANRWAAELLMPKRLFAPAVAEQPINLSVARDLTRLFDTSLIATAIRLVRLGPDSSMIIQSRLGERFKWFRRSPYMPVAAWPRREPGPESVAYRLLRGERERPGPQVVKWDQWLDLSDLYDPRDPFEPPRYYLQEDSMRMRNGDVLSLLWFDDHVPLDDIFFKQPPHRQKVVGERG